MFNKTAKRHIYTHIQREWKRERGEREKGRERERDEEKQYRV